MRTSQEQQLHAPAATASARRNGGTAGKEKPDTRGAWALPGVKDHGLARERRMWIEVLLLAITFFTVAVGLVYGWARMVAVARSIKEENLEGRVSSSAFWLVALVICAASLIGFLTTTLYAPRRPATPTGKSTALGGVKKDPSPIPECDHKPPHSSANEPFTTAATTGGAGSGSPGSAFATIDSPKQTPVTQDNEWGRTTARDLSFSPVSPRRDSSLGADSSPRTSSLTQRRAGRDSPRSGVRAIARAAVVTAAAASAPAVPAAPLITVLLVEDNPINVQVATKLLRLLKFDAHHAGNGLEAVAFVQHHLARSPASSEGREARDGGAVAPLVILMDLHLPHMDGFQAAEHIRRMYGSDRATPYILAVTADALEETKKRCLETDFDDFLAKPFFLTGLREAMNRAVARFPPLA